MKAILLTSLIFIVAGPVPTIAQDEDLLEGVRLYREGKFQEAADVLRAVVKAQPERDIAWTYLGGALENLGKHGDARSALKKKGKITDSLLQYEKELLITGKVKAEYNDDEARARWLQGNVILAVEFKADGTIGFVVVVRELSPGLAKSAVKATRAITFQPAVADGKPVTVIRPVSYEFTVR